MLFERFEVEGLSHYSYAVGCKAAGELAIVDPERNVDRYLDFAREHGLRITHVLETHIHADYASGARELAERSGAEVHVSGGDRGEDFEVAFPHRDLADGDALEVGSLRIAALHTPGHTPEHVSFLVYDTHRSSELPQLLLSGDFLFVGSLGRPDLLGEEAKVRLARAMFRSVRGKLAGLPDGLEIHPAHGAGSMCGAGMSGRPCSTLGYERASNPYLDPSLTEDRFVEKLLASVPPFPPYYRRMKKLNSAGPPLLGETPGRLPIPPDMFQALRESGHVVLDLRDHLAWCGGHIPDSFWVGAADNLAVWAAWVMPYDAPILLVADDPHQAGYASRCLVRVGLDDVAGYLAGGIAAWRTAGLPMRHTPVQSVHDVHERLASGAAFNVLDVRGDGEWASGHVEGAHHIHGGELAGRLAELPPGDAPLAVICGGGYRSTVAASVLERAGFENVVNVTGGMSAWRAAGLPVTRAGAGVRR
jgi:hydroxyacylglutathione hydrolase